MAELNTAGLKQVGEFSGIGKNRLIRSMKNPMDRCTIVSILPKEVKEVKYTIEPGVFNIPAGTPEKPAILVVGPSSWWKMIDSEQPMVEIPCSSIQVADSVIKDYCNGMLGCDMSNAMPGLMFVMGEKNIMQIQMEYKTTLEELNTKQNNWFKILCRLGDSLWARSNHNPLVISDEMRMAAKMLNEDSKPWIGAFEAEKLINCVACGGLRNPLYPVCQSCKHIDTNHPLAKELKFAV